MIWLFLIGFTFAGGNIPFQFLPGPTAIRNVWTGGGGTSAWSDAGNWGRGAVPGNSEIAFFDGSCLSNCSPNLTAGTSVGQIEMEPEYTGTITQDSGSTLTVHGAWTMRGGTFQGGNQILTVGGVFTLSGGTFNATAGTSNFNGWMSNILGGAFNGTAGALNFQGLNVANAALKLSSGTTTATLNSGGLTFGAGVTLNTNGGLMQIRRIVSNVVYVTMDPSLSFHRLDIQTANAGQIFIYAHDIRVTGDLTLHGTGVAGELNGKDVSTGGDVSVTGYGLRGSSRLIVTAANRSVDASTATEANLPGLYLDGASATTTLTGTPILNGNLGCAATGQTLSGAVIAKGDVELACTITGGQSITMRGPANARLAAYSGLGFPTGTFVIDKAGATVTLHSNFTLHGAGQALNLDAGTLNMSGLNLTVPGTLTIAAGATLTRASGTLTYGALVNNGTLNP
ncbi:MAG TPA: hypothetical protein PKC28_10695 [Bdellovibrionales bacterium]|nr:hypothetical protein [Bdellovibrionales bacterium]